LLKGHITVYEPRGQYQLQVLAVELQGVGALQAAFEKLKEKLGAEGLFAPNENVPCPVFRSASAWLPRPTGAAIRDVLQVMRRRNPTVEIIFDPVRGARRGRGGGNRGGHRPAQRVVPLSTRPAGDWPIPSPREAGRGQGEGFVPSRGRTKPILRWT